VARFKRECKNPNGAAVALPGNAFNQATTPKINADGDSKTTVLVLKGPKVLVTEVKNKIN